MAQVTGAEVRAIRRKLDCVSQVELGALCGRSGVTVSNWENGHKPVPALVARWLRAIEMVFPTLERRDVHVFLRPAIGQALFAEATSSWRLANALMDVIECGHLEDPSPGDSPSVPGDSSEDLENRG